MKTPSVTTSMRVRAETARVEPGPQARPSRRRVSPSVAAMRSAAARAARRRGSSRTMRPPRAQGCVEQRQRHPRRLAGAGRRHQHGARAAPRARRERSEHGVDRQGVGGGPSRSTIPGDNAPDARAARWPCGIASMRSHSAAAIAAPLLATVRMRAIWRRSGTLARERARAAYRRSKCTMMAQEASAEPFRQHHADGAGRPGAPPRRDLPAATGCGDIRRHGARPRQGRLLGSRSARSGSSTATSARARSTRSRPRCSTAATTTATPAEVIGIVSLLI